MTNNEAAAAGLFFIVLLIVLIVAGPFLLIWSINTLFGLAIPFTLKTWFAALLLGGAVGGSKAQINSSK